MGLKEYFTNNFIKIRHFASANKIPVTTIYNCLNGKSISVASAKRISTATGGKVKLKDLIDIEMS